MAGMQTQNRYRSTTGETKWNKTEPLPGQADLNTDKQTQETGKRGLGVNHVTLVGRLTHDPEVRPEGEGMARTMMRVATNERTDPEFHDVIAFGKLAETTAAFLAKGRLIYVDGRLHTREYETRTGRKRSTAVVADNVQFLDSKAA